MDKSPTPPPPVPVPPVPARSKARRLGKGDPRLGRHSDPRRIVRDPEDRQARPL